MRTLDEFQRSRPQRAPAAHAESLRPLAQEVVRIDALTGDAAWDHFLSYLEAAVVNTKRLIDTESLKLRNPMLVNDDAIRAVRASILALEARAATLKEVILLPKFLKEQGALARARIEEMAREAAAP